MRFADVRRNEKTVGYAEGSASGLVYGQEERHAHASFC